MKRMCHCRLIGSQCSCGLGGDRAGTREALRKGPLYYTAHFVGHPLSCSGSSLGASKASHVRAASIPVCLSPAERARGESGLEQEKQQCSLRVGDRGGDIARAWIFGDFE